jgi:hypothetical protein
MKRLAVGVIARRAPHPVVLAPSADGEALPGTGEFVRDYIDSFTTWDILSRFGAAPEALADPRVLASELGRPVDVLDSCLRALADKGFFRRESAPSGPCYRWSPDDPLASRLQEFMAATADRRGRLTALSVLLRKLAGEGRS